jgi:hypothetical protein
MDTKQVVVKRLQMLAYRQFILSSEPEIDRDKNSIDSGGWLKAFEQW